MSPGFGAWWGRAVEADVTVIVLGNIYNSVPHTVWPAILSIVLGESFAVPAMHDAAPDAKLLEALAGTHQLGPDFYRDNGAVNTSVQVGHLFDGRWWLMPTTHGEMTFQHRRYWSVLEFRRGPDGRVDELRFDGYVGRRTRSPSAWIKGLF